MFVYYKECKHVRYFNTIFAYHTTCTHGTTCMYMYSIMHAEYKLQALHIMQTCKTSLHAYYMYILQHIHAVFVYCYICI